MTTKPITADEPISKTKRTTATKIKSQPLLLIIKIAFAIFFVIGVIVGIQLSLAAFNFYSGQADAFLTEGFVSAIYPWLLTFHRLLMRVIFFIVGGLIFLRRSDDRMAIFTSVFLIAFGVGGFWHVQYTPDPTTYVQDNALFGANFYSAVGWALIFIFLYLFPDGRFAPRWLFLLLIPTLSLVYFWGIDSSLPLYADNWPRPIFLLTHMGAFIVPLVGQIYRYRNLSTPAQRQQTKWVLYALGIIVINLLISYTTIAVFSETFVRGNVASNIAYLLTDTTFLLVPLALAFAILRARLWDIDLLINKSLAYGAVAAAGLLVFFGVLVGLQLAIGQTQPIVALLIAAAFSAVIFNPLYKRAQQFVDRHIYHLRFGLADFQTANKPLQITNAGALSGKTLGKYQILDVIGKGGMGEVYKATDGTNMLAIKTLIADVSDNQDFIQRFEREAEAGISLTHPNIADVHSIEEADGVLFITMDYLDGIDLSSWLKRYDTTDFDTAHEILQGIVSALDYAHAKGFVHRDIKPSNIMLVQNDDKETYRAILMDFGITKIKDANTLTGTGAIGTIDYMAPEQISDARQVDHRADIYSLGVVCYEMLTGERPYKGGAAQVIFAHLQQPPPDPRDSNSAIPRTMAKAILKMMAKSPDDRFDSASDIIVAIS